MSTPRRRTRLRSLAALLCLVGLGLAPSACSTTTEARPSSVSGAPSPTGTVCRSTLPPQAADTLQLIAQGGPFPYRQDGQVFRNREHVLPARPTGYYHEYTVVTPGAPTRGARRIIAAQNGTDYYTADHYATFNAIDPRC
ncbi:ribonuclease [Actinoallomurus purpureus]|uniref:ribonuclease domain-containing protein n=1 Tax=Actinoallomurus purpureus TaxID=478114 RepID=UPI0020937132|nr:ribonuclease domain-containing protein [Actinoallomurus purpureus]MCO6011580.1 ribonuclease [Actinoallomurus purpureus]